MSVILPLKLLKKRADVGFVRCLVVDLLVVQTWLSGRRRGLSRWFDRLSSSPLYGASGMDYGGESWLDGKDGGMSGVALRCLKPKLEDVSGRILRRWERGDDGRWRWRHVIGCHWLHNR